MNVNKTIEIQYKTNCVQEFVKDFEMLFTDFRINKFDSKPEENFMQFVQSHSLDLDGDCIYAKNKLDDKVYLIVFDLILQRFRCIFVEKD